MLVYIYAASLYCEECGEAICAQLTAEGKRPAGAPDERLYDSDDYPKGPTEEGESDTPSHCDGCGQFLESDLTSEGEAYVRERVALARAEGRTDSVALTAWAPFYRIPEAETASPEES